MSWWRLEPNQPTRLLRRQAVATSAMQRLQQAGWGGRASWIDGDAMRPIAVMVMS